MARRNRIRSILGRSAATAGIAMFLAGGEALAQFIGEGLREARAIDRLLGQAETARLNGDCARRLQLLDEAIGRIGGAHSGVPGLTAAGRAEYRQRHLEAWARPCPPPAAATPPPPATEVTNSSPVTETPPTPTPAPAPEDPLDVRVRNEYITTIERLFAAAESERLEGQCDARRLRLFNIGDHIGVASRRGVFTDAFIAAWRARLDEARARPCPPVPPAPSPAQAIPDLRTGDAGSAERNRRLSYLGLEGGFASMQIPRANYGFVADGPPPAPETPAQTSVERPGGFWIRGIWDTGRFGAFSLSYTQADASNHIEIATGPTGTRRGWPFTAISLSGSTGLSGNVEMEVDTDVAVEMFRGDWNFRFGADPPQEALDALRARLNATAGVTVAYTDRDHLGISSITTPVIATQRLEQEVTDLELGVRLGLEAVIPFSAGVRMKLGVEAGLSYQNFDLRSVETAEQNFGAAADRQARRELSDSVGKISYAGDAIAALEVDLSPSAILFLSGEAAYFSDRARILNPPNGTFVQNGGTTSLGTDDGIDWRVSIGLIWRPRFGPSR